MISLYPSLLCLPQLPLFLCVAVCLCAVLFLYNTMLHQATVCVSFTSPSEKKFRK